MKMRIMLGVIGLCVAVQGHAGTVNAPPASPSNADAPIPTLCTSDEQVVISGETPQGYASLCAGHNTVWHYRFGEPGNITYEFPRDNSSAYRHFMVIPVHLPRDQGGSAYSFMDHGTRVYIFDILTTTWGTKHNIVGRASGISIHPTDTPPFQNIPFTRTSPGGDGEQYSRYSK